MISQLSPFQTSVKEKFEANLSYLVQSLYAKKTTSMLDLRAFDVLPRPFFRRPPMAIDRY